MAPHGEEHDEKRAFPQRLLCSRSTNSLSSPRGGQIDLAISRCLCSSNPHFTRYGPEAQRSDAGRLDMLERSCKMLPLRDKVGVLQVRHIIPSHHHRKQGEYSTTCLERETISRNFDYRSLLSFIISCCESLTVPNLQGLVLSTASDIHWGSFPLRIRGDH